MERHILSDAEIDRRVLWRVTLVAGLFFLAIAFVNASSLLDDAAQQSRALDRREPWLLEYSSNLVLIALVPLAALYERRFPVDPDCWGRTLIAHIVGSIIFSALHVAIMTVLRMALFSSMLNRPYGFWDDPLGAMIYEYRKDVLPYALIVLLLTLMRAIEENRREAAVASAEARRTGRLTLKSGGRTLFLDARTLEWAQAAGNYVDIRANGRTHLARIGLSALEQQLSEAGVEVARVHRSRIVNKEKVVEIIPTGDGDYRIRTADGSELKGSRRYRALSAT
ncbi:LytTR family DNA-binding domain-containing protein [Aminobacter sp. HY435]|uniref:LytTR family DNA-binding domain-containing protein n=1 Tax=Aminobacter sp. HY435 TaxID=2970917 RepID=UPI0022B95351|nr:LytTR family DNA-binding domain-containing protein [Aminobacter sp. HY435]